MAHTLTTGPLTGADRTRIEADVRRRYAEVGLPWPGTVTWAPSPAARRDAADALVDPVTGQVHRRHATVYGETFHFGEQHRSAGQV